MLILDHCVFVIFHFYTLKKKKMKLIYLNQQSNIKLSSAKLSGQLIILDKLKVIIHIDNHFILLLLIRICQLYLFLFQIIKNAVMQDWYGTIDNILWLHIYQNIKYNIKSILQATLCTIDLAEWDIFDSSWGFYSYVLI